MEEADASTLKKRQTVSTAAALETSKHSKAKLGAAQIQDLQLTAKNSIRSCEEIDLVLSFDTESNLSTDDDAISDSCQIGKQKTKISVKAGKRPSQEMEVILKVKKPTSAR